MNSEKHLTHDGATLANPALREALARERELSKRLQACTEHLSSVGYDARYYRDQYSHAEAILQAALAREHGLSERLQVCGEQLTTVGNDARYYRDEYSRLHADVQEVSARELQLSLHLQAILRSRSWRWTRWLRAGSRYLHTGRFNSAGTVGLFNVLQATGRRLPLPRSLRSFLGRVLMRFRRP